jgi:hypothetical protein
MKIHLLHGIHTGFANPTVPGLVPYLEKSGIQVIHPDYGFILAAETRRINPMVEGLLTPYVETGDILIGHSNGCAIIYDMLFALTEKKVIPSGVVFINGALERKITIPDGIDWLDVYFNAGDTITEVADIASFFGTAPRTWGEMGHAGYNGTDVRAANIDCGNTLGMIKVDGHSDLFTPQKLPPWGDFIEARIVDNIAKGKRT